MNKLKHSRRLAEQLTAETQAEVGGDPEANIAQASELFIVRCQSLEPTFLSAADELQQHMQSPCAAAYMLEMLQAIANPTQRKKRGMYFTPGPVVEWMISRIQHFLDARGPWRIVDPSCGGGVFLSAANNALISHSRTELRGFDISAAAVSTAQRLVPHAQLCCINPLLAGDELAPQLLTPDMPLVIVGNPPYANFGRANRGDWIDGLLADYRLGLGEKKSNLADDFIKFMRWGQYWIDRSGQGVLAFITSRTYLAGITHRQMRASLRTSFNEIEIIDLHGEQEANDENIFGIRRGVCISIFVKKREQPARRLQYASLRGSRESKLQRLKLNEIGFHEIPQTNVYQTFLPNQLSDLEASSEYDRWPRLDEIFEQYISGVQTKNDALFVDTDRDALATRMQAALLGKLEVTWPKPFKVPPKYDFNKLQPYQVAPGDQRWIYYDPQLLGRARYSVMQHIIRGDSRDNVALVFMRQTAGTGEYDHALIVDSLVSDRVFYSRRGAPFLAPLWLYETETEPRANLQAAWLQQLSQLLSRTPTAGQCIAYIYAILFTPRYRRKFAVELARDFPRIPWPKSIHMFEQWSALGQQLIKLHLGRTTSQNVMLMGDGRIDHGFPRYDEERIFLNRESWLTGISSAVCEFRLGGYQVLDHWLRSRRGRTLDANDLLAVSKLTHLTIETESISRSLDASWQELDLTP